MPVIGELLADYLTHLEVLTIDDRKALSELDTEVRSFRRGEDIFASGDRPKHTPMVLHGMLQHYALGRDGRRQIHAFYIANDVPCLEALYVDKMDTALSAAVDSDVALIANGPLLALLEDRRLIRSSMWRKTLIQAATFRGWLMRNSMIPAHASMAHFFCEMFVRAQAVGRMRDGEFELPITQETLADALGLTTVHTNRTLMQLRDARLIEWRSGRARIIDWDKLAHMAQFSSGFLHLRQR